MSIRILWLALAIALGNMAWSQIGTGVVLNVQDNFIFPGTTVDSTSVVEIPVQNMLGVPQTVLFSGLMEPFGLLDDPSIDIAANSADTIILQFHPPSLGDFSGTMIATGTVFGEAVFNFTGTGIQVILDWSPDSLTFASTALGQSSHLDVVFTNSGNGDAVLEAFDDASETFSVEFIDTYVPPSHPTCLEYNGTEFYTYYLTVDLGSDPGNSYWYIQDDYGYYGYGGSYDNAADSLELCLPSGQSSNPVGIYVSFHNYGSDQDATMTLRNSFGNEVWSLNLLATGIYEYSEYIALDLGPLPEPPSFDPGLIPEGGSQTARVYFSPQDAGGFSGSVSFETNDSNSPLIEISCDGIGISEVSGEFCDAVWTFENAPYTLVGDVVIPDGCTLTIEPGVLVEQNGASLIVLGDLIAEGTSMEPINIIGGGIQWGEGDPSSMSYVNRIDEDEVVDEVLYFNSFETNERVWEFDCYDSGNQFSYTGEQYGGSYGCDYFGQGGGCHSSTSEDDHHLSFHNNQVDGYLYLADTIFAPSTGTYEISLKTYCSDLETGVTFQLQVNSNGSWIVADEVLPRSSANHILRANLSVDAGEPIDFRLYMSNESGYNGSIGFDEVRIGALRSRGAIERFDVATYQDSVNTENGGYYTDQIYISGDTLIINAEDETLEWSTESFVENPITALLDGEFTDASSQYFLSFTHKLAKHDAYCTLDFQVKKEGYGWHSIFVQYDFDWYTPIGHSWVTETIELPFGLQRGERIDFRLVASIYSSSDDYDEIDWMVHNIHLHQLSTSDGSQRNLILDNVGFQSLNVVSSDVAINHSEFENITLAGTGNLMVDSSEFRSIFIGAGNLEMTESTVSGSENPRRGVELTGDNVTATIYGCDISNNWGDGVRMTGDSTALDISHSFVHHNTHSGVYQYQGDYNVYNEGTQLTVKNSLIGYNNHDGFRLDGDADMDYCTIVENGSHGVYSTKGFVTLDNSIVWFNNSTPQLNAYNYSSGDFAVSYSNIQGINALMTDDHYSWGEGCIGTDPLFIDELGTIDPNSPCVDGGMPWEQDAHIPVGQGSSRADMGLYGGPENDYWGGVPPPDGSAVITNVLDIPGDQGNQLGIQFMASPFDFGGLGFNVTHYSVWRDLSVDSYELIDVGDGNWEEIGMVPAQGFGQYGYTAETLVNSTPDSTGCMTNFIVVAHTTSDNIYWVSEVAGACAVDNLAPSIPIANGLILEEGVELTAQISWSAPEEEDYAYTEVNGNSGFTATLNNDTLVFDTSIMSGQTYNYTITHFDINGNPSSPAVVTLDAEGGTDVIPLKAGWNLISMDVSPILSSVESLFETLLPGNLLYITGFDNGLQFYDPNGLSFLNSLSQIQDHHGYWVKVEEADTLAVTGTPLQPSLAGLNSGWNLVGFPSAIAASPADYFQTFIEGEELLYVTGFDDGFSYFDPAGLPFLNTLNALENGFGYWVKLTDNFVEGSGMAKPASPVYIVVNGRSEMLSAFEGESVDVLNSSGQILAAIPILPDGYLMTTALFADDPTTEAVDGFTTGENIRFQFRGKPASESFTFSDGMAVKSLELEFDGMGLSAFPNPFNESLTIQGVVPSRGVLTASLFDVTGKPIQEFNLGEVTSGTFQRRITEIDLVDNGVYELKLVLNGEVFDVIQAIKINK